MLMGKDALGDNLCVCVFDEGLQKELDVGVNKHSQL
jgi:hypothetical protein